MEEILPETRKSYEPKDYPNMALSLEIKYNLSISKMCQNSVIDSNFFF